MTVDIDALRLAYWNLRHWDIRLAWNLLRVIRAADVVKCFWLFPIRRPGRSSYTSLRLRRSGVEVVLRTYSSDPDVFRQVFLERQYELPIPVDAAPRIVDAGANIGLASLYYLTRYPRAEIVALEPDPANFEMALLNTKPYRARCRVLDVALWSHRTQVSVVRGDGAWSSFVREQPDDGKVSALALQDVLDLAGWRSATIVKVDIEGAEAQVLEQLTPEATHLGRCWAIELHSDRARAAFEALFTTPQWRLTQHGEISVAVSAG